MASGANVSVRLVTRLLAVARALGADAEAIAAASGLHAADLADKDGYVSEDVLVGIWEDAAVRTQDPAFALHAAEVARLSPDNVLAYAFQHSRSLRDGFTRIAKYLAIVHRGVELVIVDGEPQARLRVVAPRGKSTRYGPEFTLALAAIAGRQYVQGFTVREVAFRHAAPTDDAEYRRVFGSAVRFGQPENNLLFDAALLETPLRDADATVCSFLEQHLDALLGKAVVPAFVDRARRAVADTMRAGSALGVDAVAARLHMSARSLQRRLQRDGLSFNRVADEVRRELAVAYLSEPKVSVGEVAFLLGFAEVSTFHRAFKRWTGDTPAAARRRLREGGPAAPSVAGGASR